MSFELLITRSAKTAQSLGWLNLKRGTHSMEGLPSSATHTLLQKCPYGFAALPGVLGNISHLVKCLAELKNGHEATFRFNAAEIIILHFERSPQNENNLFNNELSQHHTPNNDAKTSYRNPLLTPSCSAESSEPKPHAGCGFARASCIVFNGSN